MMKKLIVGLTLCSLLYSSSPKDLFNKIKVSKSSLEKTDKKKSLVNKQLQKIATKITKFKQEIEKYNTKLAKLDSSLSKQEQKYQSSKSEIASINTMLQELDKDIEARKKEFAQKLSEQLGSVIAQNQMMQKDEKSVVLKEVYERYKNYNQQELLKLTQNIEQKSALRANFIGRKDKISKGIRSVKAQKDVYKKQKKEKKQLLQKLAVQEKSYGKKLDALFKRQTVIRLTLAKLNLLQEDAAKEAKKREKELRRRIKSLKNIKFASGKDKHFQSSRKNYASSYDSGNICNYRGAKTIAPMKGAKVLKRFGSFIDPVYKIKSYNDSVTLSSIIGDKRVYNVLNGEVVFIGHTSMLGKMIIVKHDNGLHTIYTDLDKFSPFVKKGSSVKKGTILGKVKRKLIFEATKDGKFINPLRLVQI